METKEEEEDFDDAFDRSAGQYDSKNESGLYEQPSIREANNFDSQFSGSKEEDSRTSSSYKKTDSFWT